MRTTICDIDNCLADDAWRIPKINWQKHGDERYHDYHLLSGFDEAVRATDGVDGNVLPLWSGDRVIFMTARPVLYRAMTEFWLIKVAQVRGFELLMRPNGHRGTSPDVKRMQLYWLLDPNNNYGVKKEDIVMAYDDHQGVVDMYASYGIPATRHFIHSVDAFHDPIRNIAAH